METIALSALYFLAGILFITSYYYGSRLQAFIFKASVIPVLIIIFILNRGVHRSTDDTLMLVGLAASSAGDIMLTSKSPAFFKTGIAFFMLTHIMYIMVFIHTGNNFIFERPVLLIPLVAYEALLIIYLFSRLGTMKAPVIVYSTVIMTMLAAAINRYDAVPAKSFFMALTGAILFVISDSALAVNRFRKPFRLHQLVVMLTYITAQYLIVFGYFSQFSA
jgi:uncharacterized membrane protein YhhN